MRYGNEGVGHVDAGRLRFERGSSGGAVNSRDSRGRGGMRKSVNIS